MSSPRRPKKPQSVAGNHQRCWLWGRNAVLETLRAGSWKPLEVIAADALNADMLTELRALTQRQDVPLQFATTDRLTELCHSREHQGLIAKMPPFPYVPLETLLIQIDAMNATSTAPLLVVLDSMHDAFNFGAVCRAACVFGASAILVGKTGQAEVTSHVVRSSAGAINRIPIVQVDDLVSAVETLKARGVRVAAATLSARVRVQDVDLKQPTALVIGNEGQGVQPRLIAACDHEITIPQARAFDSLNAAVAAGVLLYEAHRQRINHQVSISTFQ